MTHFLILFVKPKEIKTGLNLLKEYDFLKENNAF